MAGEVPEGRGMTRSAILMMAATSGMVAAGSAATVYNETTGGSLSDNSNNPTVLPSGTGSVLGGVNAVFDLVDAFVIMDLVPGGTAKFDYSRTFSYGGVSSIRFDFFDDSNDYLDSSGVLFTNGTGSTDSLTVPASGKIKVVVSADGTNEGDAPNVSFSVSTTDVVPEPSAPALAALGALLALRRRRK